MPGPHERAIGLNRRARAPSKPAVILPSRLRHIARRLGRAPLFAAVAILTLGVGIGANAAIFSVINSVLLRPLPFNEPERLVGVWHSAPGLRIPLMSQSPCTYLTYREEGRAFEDIGLWDGSAVTVTGAGDPERVDALVVTDGILPILRVQPTLGRRFTAQDDAPQAPLRVMLTDGYWRSKFGGDASAVGRTITIDGKFAEIIGVLPGTFKFLSLHPQLVMPFQIDRAKVYVGNFSYQGIARLKPGVTIEQANADVARMIPMILDRFPLPPGFSRKMFVETRLSPKVRPLSADVIGEVGRVLWVLFGTVAIVLLIACANVANLFLIRAEGRQQELAVHAALGAGPGRVAWEILSEAVVLAVAGGVAGLGLAYAGIRVLAAVAPEGLPRIDEIAITPLVVVFTLGISILAGVFFGMLPVLKFARPRLAAALKEGGRGSSDGRERHRARNVLVVAEIALAVVLLVGSGLMLRTFSAMRHVEPGFTHSEELLSLRISIPEAVVKDVEQAARAHEQIAQQIAAIPGVRSVGVGSSVTMDGHDTNDPVFVEDFPDTSGQMPPIRRYRFVGASYVETMGNRVVAGRTITWADVHETAAVVMVSENFAREYWKDPAAAVGRRIRNRPNGAWRTIVGVVGDERDNGVAKAAPAILYWPMVVRNFWDDAISTRRTMAYAIRSERMKSPPFLKEIQQAVWSINPNVPIASVRTMDEIKAQSMAQTSFALVMLAMAAGVALLLGVVGIYGVIAYVAVQRTREIGIRMALGADRGSVSLLFVRQGLVLVVCGIAIGLIASGLATSVMGTLLFGVTATDPVTYAAVAGGLGAVALLASYLPARRAARVDPAAALRWGM